MTAFTCFFLGSFFFRVAQVGLEGGLAVLNALALSHCDNFGVITLVTTGCPPVVEKCSTRPIVDKCRRDTVFLPSLDKVVSRLQVMNVAHFQDEVPFTTLNDGLVQHTRPLVIGQSRHAQSRFYDTAFFSASDWNLLSSHFLDQESFHEALVKE